MRDLLASLMTGRAASSAGLAGDRNARALMCTNRVITIMGLASVSFSLVLRILHRGLYYPGWDILAAAQGLRLVSTKTLCEIIQFYVTQHDNPYLPGGLYGVHGALIPGWLTAMWPWVFWRHAVTFVSVLIVLYIVVRALELPGRDVGIVLLAWGASPALLSFSVTGLGYAVGFLPYAVALWTVLRLRRRWFLTLLCCAIVMELSWHVQELGRTVFVVFLAAAFFLKDASLATRIVWMLTFAIQLWNVQTHHSFNTERYAAMAIPQTADIVPRLQLLGTRLVSKPFIDLPMLYISAFLSLLLMRRHRLFWGALIACHVGLIVWLGISTGLLQGPSGVWPRRVLFATWLCLAAVVACYRSGYGRSLLLGLLLIGNVWQLSDTIRWSREPLRRPGAWFGFTLPFTYSKIDSMVHFNIVDWAMTMRADVEAGRRVILLYNLSSYYENRTNPVAVLERLYLGLGHRRFMRNVLVFGSVTKRWSTFPVRPLSEIDSVIRDLDDPAGIVGYRFTHTMDYPAAKKETDQVLKALARRFEIIWDPPRKDTPACEEIVPFRLRRLSEEGRPNVK